MTYKTQVIALAFAVATGVTFLTNFNTFAQENDRVESRQIESNQIESLKQIESKPTEKKLTLAETKIEVARLTTLANRDHDQGEYESAYEKATKACELVPNQYAYHLNRGDISFSAGKIAESIAAYDNAIELQPRLEPQLWQRGLALYYADRFQEGVSQFETHQTVNSQDVENAVWHLLCASRVSDVDAARKKLIPITGDTRIPMSQIYEMFAGRMTPEAVLKRAKKTSARFTEGSDRQKLQLYYAHLYTGLYHEMLKDNNSAIASLKKAEAVNPLGKSNFMGQVARIHLKLREAAQDDEKAAKWFEKKADFIALFIQCPRYSINSEP